MKFLDPYRTIKGEERASVTLKELKTLWFNTGSLCNLACKNCYIESSPKNDRLAFITAGEVVSFLKEIKDQSLPVGLIGFTGGEPFANPHFMEILKTTLDDGFEVLVLTNAYKTIKKSFEGLATLKQQYAEKLHLRVSLDHYSKDVHEAERGPRTFDETLSNLKWLVDSGFTTSIAGRSLKKEPMDLALAGYQQLLGSRDIKLTLELGQNIVIFPEMDPLREVPEISTGCWSILKKSPADQMCSSERMIVKKKG